MKTSTENQEQCLNPGAAVSLLYTHTSPIIAPISVKPKPHNFTTSHLQVLVPFCIVCMPGPHCCGLILAKPPPHSAASRQMSPLGVVCMGVPLPETAQITLYKTLISYYLFFPFTAYDLCSWVRNPVMLLFIMERLKDQAEYRCGETELQQKAKQQVEPIPTRTATHHYYKTTGETWWGTPASAGFNGLKKSHQQCERSAAARTASPGNTPAEGMPSRATSTTRGAQTARTRPAGEHPRGHCRTPEHTAASPPAKGRASCWSAACTRHYVLLCTLLTDVAANCCVNLWSL